MSASTTAPRVGDTLKLPLSKLILDRHNPRRDREKVADPVMIGSIRSKGLLHNLGVVPSAASPGKYVVKYGNRRLIALRALSKEGHFDKDQTFDCKLVAEQEDTDTAGTLEAQIAENIVRAAMSPIDEFEAFARLVELGLPVEEIAHRFGAQERAVRQRLALGQAAPCVRKALRDEAISLDIAKIFAGCPDTARQERVFRDLSRGGSFSDWSVRKALYQAAVAADDNLARFVGVDVYEAAGGPVERDLLSEAVHLTDTDLLIRLRDEKLARAVEKLTEDGWSWAEAHEGYRYDVMSGFDRIYGEIVPLPEDQASKAAVLEAELDALNEKNTDSDDWSLEDSDRYDEIEDKLADLRDVQRAFTPEQKAVSGCIVYPDRNGLVVQEGLVRKADRKKAKAIKDSSGAETCTDSGEASPGNAAAAYSQSLRADLKTFKSQAVQAALIEHPEIAIQLLHFVFVRKVLFRSHAPHLGTSLTAPPADYRVGHGDLGETTAATILDQTEKRLRSDILEPEDMNESWQAFCALDDEARSALIAFAFARTIEPRGHALFDRVGADLGLNIRDYWKPTAENLFSRMKKDQLADFLKDTVGARRAAQLTQDFKAKKAEFVDLCDGLIHGSVPVEPAAREALDAWAPPLMAFAAPETSDPQTVPDTSAGA